MSERRGRRAYVRQQSKIQLSKASLAELKPGHNYIIALNEEQVGHDDAYRLSGALNKIGIKAVVMLFKGDPDTGLKVIEQKNDNSHTPEPAAGQPTGLVGAGIAPPPQPAN